MKGTKEEPGGSRYRREGAGNVVCAMTSNILIAIDGVEIYAVVSRLSAIAVKTFGRRPSSLLHEHLVPSLKFTVLDVTIPGVLAASVLSAGYIRARYGACV